MEILGFSRGEVEFISFPTACLSGLNKVIHDPVELALFARKHATASTGKRNLVFNFPREQYAKLDRGDTPEAVNASWLTLSNSQFLDPSIQSVAGETNRILTSTKAVDPSGSTGSILRFIIDAGQFVGTWKTAILIGGSTAISTPGTGKIVAAVNNVKDDNEQPFNRDGTTVHLINWKIKHIDSSEV